MATWLLGGFLTVGLLAYAYLILWLTVALPSLLHGIGRDRDYSFGVYIYGFAMQQVVALVGGARWGLPGYLAVCLVSTLIVAAASWHLVEKPALQWKNWNPAAKRSMPSSGPVPEPEAEARAGARTAQEMEPRPVR